MVRVAQLPHFIGAKLFDNITLTRTLISICLYKKHITRIGMVIAYYVVH